MGTPRRTAHWWSAVGAAAGILAATVAAAPPAHADGGRTVSASPAGILVSGGWVQVSFSGYTPGAQVGLVVCDANARDPRVDCDWPHSMPVQLLPGATSASVWYQAFVQDNGVSYCDLYDPCRLYVLEHGGDLVGGAAFATLRVGACDGCEPSPQVAVTPSAAVTDGQTLTVSWTGFTAGAGLRLLQCPVNSTWASDCDPGSAMQVTPPPGATAGSAPFPFRTTSETHFTCNSSLPCAVYMIESTFDLQNAAAWAPVHAADGGGAGGGGSGGGGHTAFPSTGRVLQRFTAAQMTSGRLTQAQAVALAQANDVISGHPGMFGPYVGAMRAANPNLVLLVYVNATFAGRGQGSAYPPSWYLRDAGGQQVTSRGYGNFAMDPTNPLWVQDRINQCKADLAASGFDGCFLDMLGTSPTDPGYLSGTAIDAATGQPWTPAAWLDATTKLQGAMAAAVAPAFVAGNGLKSGASFFDPSAPSSQLLTTGAGDQAESWMRTAGAPAGGYPTESEWLQDVNLLVAAGRTGSAALVTVKVWTGASQAEIDAWHRFALASFLLGADGSQYFEFTPANSQAGILADSPWDHASVGTPAGPYTVVNGVYSRQFSNGLALVNPTGAPATVSLGGTYYDLAGNAVSSVTLASDGAEVLTLS